MRQILKETWAYIKRRRELAELKEHIIFLRAREVAEADLLGRMRKARELEKELDFVWRALRKELGDMLLVVGTVLVVVGVLMLVYYVLTA